VTIDGGSQQVYIVGKWSSSWQWSLLQRHTNGIDVPMTFTGAGSHSVLFRGREADTRLDRLFITNDPTAMPVDPPVVPEPVISGVAVADITSNSATVSWITDEQSDGEVDYGTTTNYGSSSVDSSLVTSHRISLGGLTAGTQYHFQVISRDAVGN